jgi:Ribbon-helix-helix protein, copG family
MRFSDEELSLIAISLEESSEENPEAFRPELRERMARLHARLATERPDRMLAWPFDGETVQGETMQVDDLSVEGFAYKPVDSAVPVPAQERHTEEQIFRVSPHLRTALERLAEREQTSVSEIIRDAISVRWDV